MTNHMRDAGLRESLVFLAIALALIAGHIECANPLFDEAPLKSDPWSLVDFRLWMLLALASGLLFPALAAVVTRGAERLAYALIALGLVLQIALEIAARRFGVVFSAELIGLLFTGWRLWQLWRARQLGTSPWLRGAAIFASLFWALNLALLTATLAPRIV